MQRPCNAWHASELSELLKVFGGNVGGVIPDPIPNSEVKPSRADGTARGTAWESRTPPELILRPRLERGGVSFSTAVACADESSVGLARSGTRHATWRSRGRRRARPDRSRRPRRRSELRARAGAGAARWPRCSASFGAIARMLQRSVPDRPGAARGSARRGSTTRAHEGHGDRVRFRSLRTTELDLDFAWGLGNSESRSTAWTARVEREWAD